MKKQIQYASAGGGTVAATLWMPASKPVGIVQIIHGIAEHVSRYEEFATYLNEMGYLVAAEDHMGHGATAALGGTVGYFSGGWWSAVEDTCNLMRIVKEEEPEILEQAYDMDCMMRLRIRRSMMPKLRSRLEKVETLRFIEEEEEEEGEE